MFVQRIIREVYIMSRGNKPKADPSTIGLNSPQVEGQGTTTTETGSFEVSSARKKQKRY
jgi:hypothetical protein